MNKFLLVCLCLFPLALAAQAPTPPEPPPVEQAAPTAVAESSEALESPAANQIVSVGHSSSLAAGESAISVVSVFGSSTSAGDVSNEVVSVFGSSRVTGPVGNQVVSVLGNTYVNSHIGGDAVAVLGNVVLGPQAEVGGQVVAVGGNVKRDPAAIVHGGVQNVGGGFFQIDWIQPWIKHCLLLGRPLAIAPGLSWAWGLALGFLALYVFMGFLFREGVDRCIETLETHPGRSILAALLALLITPVLFVLLCITVIGIAVIPFLGLALFIAGLFGKAVMLGWMGRRIVRSPSIQTGVAVLIGGVIVLALYLVPVLGFVVYKGLGVLGLGVVIYTLILANQRRQAPAAAAAAAAAQPASSEVPPPQPPTAAAQPEPVAAVSSEAATLPRAGFWIRMGALFLDIVLIGIILALFHNAGKVELLLLAIYGAVMWKLKGSTIGGIVCGLKVVRLDGRPVDWTTAIVRALSCFLSLAIAGLGFFWIAFDDGKQAWHDKIAGTAVVRAPKGHSLV
jgi:uncharacterized RDD family membrane protein YckC